MGIENKYMPLVSVTTYPLLAIAIATTAIFALLLFIKPLDEFDMGRPIGSNLAALLAALGVVGLPRFVTVLLTFVDVFYIWKVVLIGIGCAAVSRKLKTSSAIVYAGIVASVIALIFALEIWGYIWMDDQSGDRRRLPPPRRVDGARRRLPVQDPRLPRGCRDHRRHNDAARRYDLGRRRRAFARIARRRRRPSARRSSNCSKPARSKPTEDVKAKIPETTLDLLKVEGVG